MVVIPVSPPTLDAYQLRLPVFEGPLDVLLRLIEREQLPVSDVSLVAVLDQFMAFIAALDGPSAAVIADFTTVACRLSALKSRALLPKPAPVPEEGSEPDLVKQLEEYRSLKHAAAFFAGRQQEGTGGFARGESIAVPATEPPRLIPQPRAALTRAVSRWLTRLPQRPSIFAPRRVVALREMISRIFSSLDSDHPLTFEKLRADCDGKQDVAVAFLALLTLMRRQLVEAAQPSLFGPISIVRPRPRLELVGATDSSNRGGADGADELLA